MLGYVDFYIKPIKESMWVAAIYFNKFNWKILEKLNSELRFNL